MVPLGESSGPGSGGGGDCSDGADEVGENHRLERVPDARAITRRADEAGLTQDAEMFGDGRLSEVDGGGDVAGLALPTGHELVQDLQPGWMSESARDIGDSVRGECPVSDRGAKGR